MTVDVSTICTYRENDAVMVKWGSEEPYSISCIEGWLSFLDRFCAPDKNNVEHIDHESTRYRYKECERFYSRGIDIFAKRSVGPGVLKFIHDVLDKKGISRTCYFCKSSNTLKLDESSLLKYRVLIFLVCESCGLCESHLAKDLGLAEDYKNGWANVPNLLLIEDSI